MTQREIRCRQVYVHIGATMTVKHTHTNMQNTLAASCQTLPLFFCSMASCFSRVSLSSRSLNSSIFSSVFSSCTCFSWARALSIATLSRPYACVHAHTIQRQMHAWAHKQTRTRTHTEKGESRQQWKWEWCGLFKSFNMKRQLTTLKVCHSSSLWRSRTRGQKLTASYKSLFRYTPTLSSVMQQLPYDLLT